MCTQSVARGQEIDCTIWRLERAAAQRIYGVPDAPDLAGGWTKLFARISGL
jgi:hypothetical protein